MGLSATQIRDLATTPSSVFVDQFVLGTGPISVAIKDVIDIEGYPTKLGSAAFDQAEPATKNAEIVDRLLANMATIVGKTNLHELAYGVTGINKVYGTPKNPKYPTLIPGGSSSGSAVAIAAGLCDAAIGTDTGGSIRVPAACCGILGLKPTYGRISRVGLTPRDSSLDCVGPFAKDVDTLAAVMSVIDSTWNKALASTTAQKINFLKCDALPEIVDIVKRAAQIIDPEVSDVEVSSLEDAHRAGLTIIAHETYAAFGYLLESGMVDAEVAKRLARASEISDRSLVQAERVRDQFGTEIDQLLENADILALPTLAGYPPEVEDAGDLQSMVNITSLGRPFNLSGHPAIAIPINEFSDRPVSLQLVARRGEDERLIACAREFENLRPQAADKEEIDDV